MALLYALVVTVLDIAFEALLGRVCHQMDVEIPEALEVLSAAVNMAVKDLEVNAIHVEIEILFVGEEFAARYVLTLKGRDRVDAREVSYKT